MKHKPHAFYIQISTEAVTISRFIMWPWADMAPPVPFTYFRACVYISIYPSQIIKRIA